eukprot:TRINITY_DN1073_c0_g1_i1.p1 TRINITY_DN1073_c0_g1~~TRINITY_DN1073_c0_g1_i1.p1  ORF type:complete len:323 (+),score=49.15 TRINITY_DN1073_c0_g1_i1:160-1128(+)
MTLLLFITIPVVLSIIMIAIAFLSLKKTTQQQWEYWGFTSESETLPQTTSEDNTVTLVAPVMGFPKEKVLHQTQEIYRKPLHLTPIHIDLPRLALRMKIIDNRNDMKIENENEKKVPRTENTTNIDSEDAESLQQEQYASQTIQAIYDVLITLANKLEPETSEKIAKHFNTYFRYTNTDLSIPLLAFLKEVIGPSSRVIKVLQACHQGIIAPSVISLKIGLGSKLAYNGDGWAITIIIENDKIVIKHERQEKIIPKVKVEFTPREVSENGFKYIVEMQLDKELTAVSDVSCTFLDFFYNEDAITSDRVLEIRNLLLAGFTEC